MSFITEIIKGFNIEDGVIVPISGYKPSIEEVNSLKHKLRYAINESQISLTKVIGLLRKAGNSREATSNMVLDEAFSQHSILSYIQMTRNIIFLNNFYRESYRNTEINSSSFDKAVSTDSRLGVLRLSLDTNKNSNAKDIRVTSAFKDFNGGVVTPLVDFKLSDAQDKGSEEYTDIIYCLTFTGTRRSFKDFFDSVVENNNNLLTKESFFIFPQVFELSDTISIDLRHEGLKILKKVDCNDQVLKHILWNYFFTLEGLSAQDKEEGKKFIKELEKAIKSDTKKFIVDEKIGDIDLEIEELEKKAKELEDKPQLGMTIEEVSKIRKDYLFFTNSIEKLKEKKRSIVDDI